MGYDGRDWWEDEWELWDSECRTPPLTEAQREAERERCEALREAEKRIRVEMRPYAGSLRKRLKDSDDRIFICKRLLQLRPKLMNDKEREFVENMSSHWWWSHWPTSGQRAWLLYLCCQVWRRCGAEVAEEMIRPRERRRRPNARREPQQSQPTTSQ